ncbi:MAG: hypothetical protein GY851_06260 [bacterium]|nr:hypothetical protein [bacterium]
MSDFTIYTIVAGAVLVALVLLTSVVPWNDRRLARKIVREAGVLDTEGMRTIAGRMLGQDNAITAHPIFMVQQRRRVYGMDPDWSDVIVWVYDGAEIASVEDEFLEWCAEHAVLPEDSDVVRTGAFDYYENVQPFFSRKAAEHYIIAYGYNLTDPRVYVESGYRNHEWQAVRKVLLDMVGEA